MKTAGHTGGGKSQAWRWVKRWGNEVLAGGLAKINGERMSYIETYNPATQGKSSITGDSRT